MTARYLLVNRRGGRVLVASAEQLAALVREGRLRLLTPHLVTNVAQPAPYEALRAAGAELETRDYPMGHGISPDEARDVRQVAMIDAQGRVSAHTGAKNIADAGTLECGGG